MSSNVLNFRFPVESLLEGQPEGVVRAHRITTNNIVALSTQLANLQAQITAAKAATASSAAASASSSTVIEEAGVTSFNAATGAIIYFPALGMVNDQSGQTSYTTEQSDNGAEVVLDSIYPIGVTLSASVNAPWFTFINNLGGGTATLTPSAGEINGGASLDVDSGSFALVFFDGTNFWGAVSGSTSITQLTRTIGITIDGGGNAPSTGIKGFVTIPYNCTITGWTAIADQSGSASVDVCYVAGSGAPPTAPNIPTDSNKISASAPVVLSSAQSAAGGSSAISTWSTSLGQWGTVMFNLNSVTTCTRVSVQLFVQLA